MPMRKKRKKDDEKIEIGNKERGASLSKAVTIKSSDNSIRNVLNHGYDDILVFVHEICIQSLN